MPLPQDFYRQLAKYYDLIFIPPACIGVGLAIGWYLDNYFQLNPWCKLVCILLGSAAAFWQIFRTLWPTNAKTPGSQDNKKNYPP